ncbi:TIM barrel domain-containing protein (plasmid) [Rhizobium gallicum]|uniref:TIM barrel domain-containing protein n=1 Tax=Rhizobium gallicum TaxID=56730 RepID=A0A1L5NXT7_9HYPH|nr:TIM barrel domain-containing protein [Rhizobium gallicum]
MTARAISLPRASILPHTSPAGGRSPLPCTTRAAIGHIFIQLMHAGRMSHPDNTPHHRQGVAPGTGMFTVTGMQDIPTPRALTTEEVRQTVADFRHAAAYGQMIRCAAEG